MIDKQLATAPMMKRFDEIQSGILFVRKIRENV